uniref:Uncharacterized protein n=1 Tax=Arundo donax TaxID=35708 RepID=A0A0A9E9Y4_ARUDO
MYLPMLHSLQSTTVVLSRSVSQPACDPQIEHIRCSGTLTFAILIYPHTVITLFKRTFLLL